MYIHYGDVIMGTIASQITSPTIVYSTVYSDADQRKHQSSASLAYVRGIHRGPVNSPQMASNAGNVSIWWRHHVLHDRVYRRGYNRYLTSYISLLTWSRHKCMVIVRLLAIDCDVIPECKLSEWNTGRYVKIIVFIVIYGFIMSC